MLSDGGLFDNVFLLDVVIKDIFMATFKRKLEVRHLQVLMATYQFCMLPFKTSLVATCKTESATSLMATHLWKAGAPCSPSH